MNFVHQAWLTIGTIDHPNEMVQECEGIDSGFLTLGWIILGLILIIVLMGASLIMTMFVLPAGICILLYAGISSLILRDTETLVLGTKVVSVGLSGVLLGGVSIHIIHYVTGLTCA